MLHRSYNGAVQLCSLKHLKQRLEMAFSWLPLSTSTIQIASKGSAMATHSQMDKDPCPSCRKFIPKTDVRNEIGKKMNVKRFVAFVNRVTSTACSLERFASSMEALLMIVDRPASQSVMMF